MAKDSKPQFVFEDIDPRNRQARGQDHLRVTEYGISFSTLASQRYLPLESVSVQVSADKRAIKVTEKGAFRVTRRQGTLLKTGGRNPTAHVNSVVIPQKARIGIYLYQGDGLFVWEGENG